MANPLSSLITRLVTPAPPAAPAMPVVKAEPPLAVGVVPGYSTTLRQDALGQPWDVNYDLLYRTYQLHPDVSGCIDRWISAVTGNGWRITLLEEGTEANPVLDDQMHQIAAWLANPNPNKRFDLLVHELIMHLGICGNAYWQVITDSKGQPQEIWSLHPASVRIVADIHGDILGYVQRLHNQKPIIFQPDEIVHIKLPSPNNDLYGEAPLVRALEEVKHDLKAVRATERLFDNGFAPSAVLLMDKDLSPKQVEEFVKSFRRQHEGVENNAKLAALQGATDLKPYGSTPRDMEFSQLRALSTEKIATVYGVPKLFLNQKDAADYATSDVMERQLYYGKGKPLQQLIAASITEAIIHAFNPALKFEWLMPEFGSPESLRADAVAAFQAGAMDADELRTNFFALPAKSQTTEEDAGDTPEPEPGEEVTDPVEVDSANPTANPVAATKRVAKSALQQDLAQQRDATQAQLAAPLVTPIAGYFAAQSQAFLAALKRYPTFTLSQLEDYLKKADPNAPVALAAVLAALLAQTLTSGTQAAADQTGQPVAESDIADALAAYRTDTLAAHAAEITGTTTTQLQASLQQGLMAGESPASLQTRVNDIFDAATKTRAPLIARAETAQAFQAANHAVLGYLAEQGKITRRQWLVSDEESACGTCAPMDGTTVGVDEPYPNGMEPGDVHIGCLCSEIGLP